MNSVDEYSEELKIKIADEYSEELKIKIAVTRLLIDDEKTRDLVSALIACAFIEGNENMLKRVEKTIYGVEVVNSTSTV